MPDEDEKDQTPCRILVVGGTEPSPLEKVISKGDIDLSKAPVVGPDETSAPSKITGRPPKRKLVIELLPDVSVTVECDDDLF